MIGNGNVATDVARMLALTREELEDTDTAEHAIEAFAESGSARSSSSAAAARPRPRSPTPRSASSARWSTPTSTSTPPSSSSTRSASAYLDSDEADITTAQQRRDLHRVLAAASRRASSKRIVLRFLRSPVEIQGDGKVERIVVGAKRALPRRVRRDPGPRHRRARDDRVRPRLALDRLQGSRRSTEFPSTSAAGDPERGRPGDRSRERSSRSRATTPSAGSSAAPPA